MARGSRWVDVLGVTMLISGLAFARPAEGQMDFRRGDVDGDGELNFVADAAYLSAALFGGGPGLDCFDAADFGDDGLVDLTDIALLLNVGFFGGMIPAPSPGCGPDPTPDSLGCETYDCAATPDLIEDSGISFGVPASLGTAGELRQVSFGLGLVDREVTAWSIAVCANPAVVEVVSVEPGVDLLSLTPDFEERLIFPGQGWTGAVLLRFDGSLTLGPGEYELYDAEYSYVADGMLEPRLCDDLPVQVTFVVGQAGGEIDAVLPIEVDGGILGTRYRRGDANGDGIVDLADPIWMIAYSFQDGTEPTCERAADANQDQQLNVADAIWLISYVFVEGPPPPSPFPGCGFVGSALGCESYSGCP